MIRRPLGVDGAEEKQYFYFVSVSTVEPSLSSHPQGTGKWPLMEVGHSVEVRLKLPSQHNL